MEEKENYEKKKFSLVQFVLVEGHIFLMFVQLKQKTIT